MKRAKVAIIYLLLCKNNLYYDFVKNHREKNKREEFKYLGDGNRHRPKHFCLDWVKTSYGKI